MNLKTTIPALAVLAVLLAAGTGGWTDREALAQARFDEISPLPGEEVVKGEVLEVEDTFYIVKDVEGKEIRLLLSKDTMVKGDFKPGDKIEAHVNEEGYLTAIKYLEQRPEGQKTPGPGK